MKKLLSILWICTVTMSYGQSLMGAWAWTEKDEAGKDVKGVVIFAEGYQAATWYEAQTGAFVATNGGLWSIEGNTVTETIEFDTSDPENRVGATISFEIEWDGNDRMRVAGEDTWNTRIDSGEPGKLDGAWLISGRMRDGKVQERNIDRPRKTMKILSGTRFQWIAYNTETRQFLGTGGGSYSTVNGKYTENIEFFSRDNSRVGASLEFQYEIKDGKWHHSGNNSRGEPMYEVWSKRE